MSEEKITRGFKGIWIPKEVWLDEDLKWMEKLLLVEINSLDNEKGCYASNNYFAKFFKLTPGRISQLIKSLEKKGKISIEYTKKGKEITGRVVKILNTPLFNKLNGGIKKIKGGYLENDKGINTKNNNTNINNTKEERKIIPPPYELLDKHIKSKNITKFTADEFYNFYESKNWMIGKNKMVDWHSAIRTWEKREDKNFNYKKQKQSPDEFEKAFTSLQKLGALKDGRQA